MQRLSLLKILIVFLLAVCAAQATPNKLVKPHVTATLLSDHASIAPGLQFRLGVLFEIDNEWHIYWPTPGEPDAPANPTKIKLTVPTGFKASGPQFPPPTRHPSDVGELYILEGKPVVLFDVTAPAQLSSASATCTVDAEWLCCKESCIPGDGKMELALPVVKAGEEKRTNEKLFKAAAKALPLPSEKASYVKISARASQDRVRPGDKFEVHLLVDVKKGYHIQSDKPEAEGLIGTQVFVEPAAGLEMPAKPKYPAAKTRIDKDLGKISEYSGQVDIVIPFEASNELKGEKRRISGVLEYQACADSGTCYPPEDVSFAFDIPLAKSGDKIAAAPTPLVMAKADDAGTSIMSASPEAGDARPPKGAKAAGASTSVPASAGGADLFTRLSDSLEKMGTMGYLILAFLGGLLLNVMPCVLPVISLKVLSFVKQAHEDRLRIFTLGLTFSAGILLSFAALGALILLAKQSWGGLFQYPQVVIGLAALVTAFAMSLFGVFTLSPPAAIDQLGAKASGEGYGHALAMGMLATVLGTACTAPFLSAVVAVAVQKPALTGFAIFLTAGFGMALPYVVLTAKPVWLRFVPRSGPWMKTFEEVMGFLLLGTAIWLMYSLPAQITGKGLVWALVFILCVAFAAWLFGRVQFGDSVNRRARYYSAALCMAVVGWLIPFRLMNTIAELQQTAKAERLGQFRDADLTERDFAKDVPWRLYTHKRAVERVRAGYTVLVDFTADWCFNCKVNERTSINIEDTRKLMAASGVIPFKADYTNQDPDITEDLLGVGRSGVPTVVVYPAGKPDAPIVLPVVLTPGIVQDALRQAGPSEPRDKAKPERLAQRE